MYLKKQVHALASCSFYNKMTGTNIINTTKNTTTPRYNAFAMGSSSNNASSTGNNISKLEDDECKIIIEHNGCLRCCKLYTDHVTCDCTAPPLRCDTYVKLMPEAAAKAKTANDKCSKLAVAAIFGANSEEEDNMGDDSEDTENNEEDQHTNEYVPDLTPSLPQHLFWNCHISAPSCAPSPVCTFIDSRATPVLFSSNLATRLELPRRTLAHPFLIFGAFSEKNNGSLQLKEYVKITLQFPDAQWQSRIQLAIISPTLHSDLIISLDFLQTNFIVINAHAHTAIDKQSNFDLLHSSDPRCGEFLPKPHRLPCAVQRLN
ncbi:hypothetical protein Hypma_003742 [Hypsizygus marmoreus]|uniref:Uncharacterized protein n=1 Tax=Hypsizygus marmoreus TaxID=39966 RepID=A0A369J1A9_HYPMA|nr:hypothetical protein Hypma_003742 [Hypsizygus marmoreus]